jgi:hypothetical protein
MRIEIHCRRCSRKLLVDEAFSGGVARCPHCGAMIDVPEGAPDRDGERPETPPHHLRAGGGGGSAGTQIPIALPAGGTWRKHLGLAAAVLVVLLLAVLAFAVFSGGAEAGTP